MAVIKADLHIPTREFGFIELHIEGEDEYKIVESYLDIDTYYKRRQMEINECEIREAEERIKQKKLGDAPFGSNPNFNEGTEGKKQAFKPLR